MYLLQVCLQNPEMFSEVIVPTVATAVGLMVFMLALFYMAAAFFRKPEYESFVSLEMHQVLVSVLLFLFVFGAAGFACEASMSLAGGDMWSVGRDYLNTISNQVALPALVQLEISKMVAQYWGSLSFRWGLAVWGTLVPGFPAFILVERVIDFLLMLLTPFVASLMAQEIGLEVLRATAIPLLLPAGVVLRIFPPTRDAGSFLIASSLAFGIVFPYTYVMHSRIMNELLSIEQGNQETLDKVVGEEYGLENLSYSINEGNLWSLDGMLLKPLRALSYLVMQAVFLPALSMALTIAFIKGTAKFMSQKLE